MTATPSVTDPARQTTLASRHSRLDILVTELEATNLALSGAVESDNWADANRSVSTMFVIVKLIRELL